jgi:hypothetical protein
MYNDIEYNLPNRQKYAAKETALWILREINT